MRTHCRMDSKTHLMEISIAKFSGKWPPSRCTTTEAYQSTSLIRHFFSFAENNNRIRKRQLIAHFAAFNSLRFIKLQFATINSE